MPEERVTRSVVLPTSPDDVWSVLTKPDELSAWLGEVLELDLRAGGTIVVRDGRGTRRGVIEAAETARLLAFRWRRLAGAGISLEVSDASRVAFELEAVADGTRLTVTEEVVPLMGAVAER